jgi:hypothetical protein
MRSWCSHPVTSTPSRCRPSVRLLEEHRGERHGGLGVDQLRGVHRDRRFLTNLTDHRLPRVDCRQFGIGIHNEKHDFDNHLRVGIFEGINPSDSLDELAEKTDTHEQMAYMAGSTFSCRTNERDYRAVVQVLFELLHTPQLYHQRGVHRKRLEWLDRAVVATDATNLTLTRSVAIPSNKYDGEILREIQPNERGVILNLAACIDGEHKHPLGMTVTASEPRESPQFDNLQDDVEVFVDLDLPVRVCDRGYLDYDRFCEMKRRDEGFVTLLQAKAQVDILEHIQDVEITDKAGTRQVCDQRIELAETGEEFQRIVFEALTTKRSSI